jgi:hypothetical protein
MSPNEKEISHERGPWQAPSSSFDQGPLGFIDWLDVCVTTLELLLYMFERLPRVPLLHPAPAFQASAFSDNALDAAGIYLASKRYG